MVRIAGGPFRALMVLLLTSAIGACGGDDDGGSGKHRTYTVSGTVQGLNGSGLVLQLDGGSNAAPVSASGPFSFPTALPRGAAYGVSVRTQPGNPSQQCTVANDSGVILSANVTNVLVDCVNSTYTVGGTVSGLLGSGLMLRLNGSSDLAVATDGPFSFGTVLATSATYIVTALAQPLDPSQTCALAGNNGAYAGHDVTDFAVTCSTNEYAVGGTVSGLAGSGLVLQLNDGHDLPVAANGPFTFATRLASGTTYWISLLSEPSAPKQLCEVADDSGVVAAADVAATVTCTDFAGYVYVVDAVSNAVYGYRVEPATGALAAVPSSPFATGPAPSAIAVDPDGTFAYVANSADDTISAYRIDARSGSLTPVAGSPFAAGDQPGAIVIEPSGKFAYVANVGDNTIGGYSIDLATGALSRVGLWTKTEPGFGVGDKRLVLHPAGRWLYAVNSEAFSVSGYGLDAQTGLLTAAGKYPVVTKYSWRPQWLVLHPTGTYVFTYAEWDSARGDRCRGPANSATGELQFYCNIMAPAEYRDVDMAFHPDGKFAYITDRNSLLWIASFDVRTGYLISEPNPDPARLPARRAAAHPGGQFLFTAHSQPNFVSAYRVDAATGGLTLVPGSPFPGGVEAVSIAVTR